MSPHRPLPAFTSCRQSTGAISYAAACNRSGTSARAFGYLLATGGSNMFKGKRKCVLGAAAAIALSIVPISAFSQSIEIGPGGVRVYDERGGGQCEQLRRACENKDALGERGEGNCRRYRETCQRPVRRDVCGELRQACLNKDQLGEQGEGNCRRYRETCRGRL
jgi:hypothetical protein